MQAKRSFVLGFIALCLTTTLTTGCRDGMASKIVFWGKMPDEKRIVRLKELGVKSLINVRTNPIPHTRKLAESHGLKFFQIKTGVMLEPSRVEIEKFIDIVSNPENQPVYIFCVGGRDRTAFYIALYRMAMEGWTPEQAKTELKAHHLRRGWPIFWKYDDVLSENYEWIKQTVAARHAKLIPTQSKPDDSECPCVSIKDLDKTTEKDTQL